MKNPLAFKYFYRKNLPHLQPAGATIFVTFRLAGSLPDHVVRQLKAEALHLEKVADAIRDLDERHRHRDMNVRRMFGRWDSALGDSSSGPYWLRDVRVAAIVRDAIFYRDGQVYDLDTFCIMSNHVHLVITPLDDKGGGYWSLPAILQSLKRYTALEGNRILGRKGQFWYRESYDHVIRDEGELQRIRRYVLENPVKAGLVESWDDWQWSFCKSLEEQRC